MFLLTALVPIGKFGMLFPFLFAISSNIILDSLDSHSLRSVSSEVRLRLTTGSILLWEEVARITVWMLLQGDEKGNVPFQFRGEMLDRVLGGIGLTPVLFPVRVSVCVYFLALNVLFVI